MCRIIGDTATPKSAVDPLSPALTSAQGACRNLLSVLHGRVAKRRHTTMLLVPGHHGIKNPCVDMWPQCAGTPHTCSNQHTKRCTIDKHGVWGGRRAERSDGLGLPLIRPDGDEVPLLGRSKRSRRDDQGLGLTIRCSFGCSGSICYSTGGRRVPGWLTSFQSVLMCSPPCRLGGLPGATHTGSSLAHCQANTRGQPIPCGVEFMDVGRMPAFASPRLSPSGAIGPCGYLRDPLNGIRGMPRCSRKSAEADEEVAEMVNRGKNTFSIDASGADAPVVSGKENPKTHTLR